MKLFIDISVLLLATFVTGIQRAAIEFIVRFIHDENFSVILIYYNAAKNIYFRINNDFFVNYYAKHKGIKERMISRREIDLHEIRNGTVFLDLDAAWMCKMKRSYLLPILKGQGAKIVPLIYDVISITHPQYCLQRGVYNFMDYIGAHLLYADFIMVNARATVLDLKKLALRVGCKLPPCTVIPLGADFNESGEVNKSEINRAVVYSADLKPFILMVGTIEPRKNHKLLLKAYDVGLKQLGYNVIFAGYMGWDMEDFEAQLNCHPDFGKRVYHFEGLNDNDIAYLYKKAKFLAFCSYAEGFGLPIIEALKNGTPVISSDIAVSREVGGKYCEWFKQDDVDDLCRIVKKYENNDSLYHELKSKLKDYKYVDWDTASAIVMHFLKGIDDKRGD